MRIISKAGIFVATSLTAFFASAQSSRDDLVGVMVSSFGDVSSKEEIGPFVRKTLQDPDVAPLPRIARPLIVWLGWEWKKKDIFAEYEAIGWNTRFRENSQAQADAIAESLRREGLRAKGYIGMTMTTPWVADGLAQMERDGVTRAVIFYQGAQYSRPTAYVVQREAAKAVKSQSDWDASVTMVKSFSDDPRFRQLMVAGIKERLTTTFTGVAADDVCIVLPMHGNPTPLVEAGDPGYPQMMGVVEAVRDAFPEYAVFHGFQNHDELSKNWTQPKMDTVAAEVAAAPCSRVLINGRISFTVDSLETLYDHAIAERSEILDLAPEKTVFVEQMFNSDPAFVELMKNLALEALQGMGDTVELAE